MNDMLANLIKPIVEIWKGISPGRKIAIVAAALIPFVLLLVFAFRPQEYKPVFTNLQTEDVAEVVSALEEESVPYRLSQDGSAILVPEDQVYRARVDLASQGLPKGGVVGFELFDSNPLGLTDFDQRVRYTRALQGELTRTIMSLEEVVGARVHIALPEESLFVQDEQRASASVVLQLRPGTILSSFQIAGIVNLVSSSVRNLHPEDVTVLDSNGNILSEPNHDSMFADKVPGGSVLERLQIERRFEQEQEQKLASMLEQVFGIGNAVVRVSARLNFDFLEERAQLVTPADEGVVVSEETTSESYTGTPGGGSPGVDSNVPGYEVSTTGSSSYEKETTRREYELGTKETYRVVAPGVVEQMSVAVWLDAEVDPAMTEKVRDAVLSASGLDLSRGDSLTVESIAFQDADAVGSSALASAAPTTESSGQFPLLYVLGAAGAIALAVLALRRRRPEPGPAGSQVDVSVGEAAVLETAAASEEAASGQEELSEEEKEKRRIEKEVRRIVEESPEEVARLIKMWLSEE